MKKNLLAITAFSILSTGTLSARVLLCEECLPEPECIEHLFVERCEWLVHGEFLYWGVATGTLDYAAEMTKPHSPGNTFQIGKYKTADYEFRPGFRIAGSYYNCPKYWEVTLQYTWFDDRGTDSANAPIEGNQFLVPTRTTNAMGPFLHASSNISLGYQLGDLYAARIFDPNPHLRMRVYAGATMARIEQKWDIAYTNTLGNVEKLDEDWRFFGGGIRLGITADWFWGYQFYLTGRISMATLFGDYKNHERQKSGSLTLANAIYDAHRFAYNVQFILGPSWQIPCDCWSFELFAGYESNLWFNIQERIRSMADFVDESKETLYANSVLGVQGLTVRLTLGF